MHRVRRPGGKADLLRIVRGTDGSVNFDAKGRAPGRGAYVCSEECLRKARDTKRLERALKTKMSDSDYERVEQQMRDAAHTVQG